METRNHNVLGHQHAMAGPLDPPGAYPMGPGGQAYPSGGPMHPGAMHGQPPGAVMQHSQPPQQPRYGAPMHQHHQMQAQMKMQGMMGYDGGGGQMPGGPGGASAAAYGHYGGRMQGDYSAMNPAMYKQNMMMRGHAPQQQQHPAAGNFSPANHMYMQRGPSIGQGMVNRAMQARSDAQMGVGAMGHYQQQHQHPFPQQHPQRAMMPGSSMGGVVPQNPTPGSMLPHNHMHRPNMPTQQHMQMMTQQNMHQQHQQYPGTSNHNTGLMGLNSQYIGSPPPSHLMSPPHQAMMAQKQQQQQQYGQMNMMSPTSQQGAQQGMNYPQQVGAMGGMMNQTQHNAMMAASNPNKGVAASQLPDFRTFASMGQPGTGQPQAGRMTMHGHPRRASTPHLMSPPPPQMQMPSPGHMMSPKMYANTPPMTSPVSSIHSLQSPPPLSHPSVAVASKSVTTSPISSQGTNTFVTSSNMSNASNMNTSHQSYQCHLQQQQHQMMQQLHHQMQEKNMAPYPGAAMPHQATMPVAVSLPPSLPGTNSVSNSLSSSTVAAHSSVAMATASHVPTSSSPSTTSSVTMTTSCGVSQPGLLTQVVTCHSTVVSCHSTATMSVQGSRLKQETCDKMPGRILGDKHIIKTTVESICVPFGWRRVVEAGAVVYYSPSGVRLSSLEHVQQYLQSEGTCKCGLECPLHVNKTFNFDPQVTSRPWRVPEDHMTLSGDLTKLCNHKRKLLAMATLQNSAMQKKVENHGERGTGPSPEGKRSLSPGSADKEKACKRHVKNLGEEVVCDNPLMAQLMREKKAEGRHGVMPNNNNAGFMYRNHMENKVDNVADPLHKMEMLVDGTMQKEQLESMMNGPHPHFGPHAQDGHAMGHHHNMMGHPPYPMKMPHGGPMAAMHQQGFKMNHDHGHPGMPPGNLHPSFPGPLNPHHRHTHPQHMMHARDDMYGPMMGRMPGPLGPLPSPGSMNHPPDQVNWTCPTEVRKKRPRGARKTQPPPKGTSIWDRLSPCPNVDVRTLAKDGKLPSLDNPRGFMEAEMWAHSLGQGGLEDHDLHTRPSRTPSAGSGKSLPLDKSTPLQSPRPPSCQLSPGSTRSTPKQSARNTPVSSIMASLTNAGALRSDELHNSLPFLMSSGGERDKPHISINTNLPEGAVNSIFSAVVSPKAKQLPSPSQSKSRTPSFDGRSTSTTTVSEPLRSSFVQSLFGQKCHTNFPASSLLSAAARAQLSSPEEDRGSSGNAEDARVVMNGSVSPASLPELTKTTVGSVTMTVSNPGDMNLSTLTMMDGMGGGIPVDTSESTAETSSVATSSSCGSSAAASSAATNASSEVVAPVSTTKINSSTKRKEQTPIQMVQNMITGLEATQNAIAACLASANAEEEQQNKIKQQRAIADSLPSLELRKSSSSSVESTSSMSSTAGPAEPCLTVPESCEVPGWPVKIAASLELPVTNESGPKNSENKPSLHDELSKVSAEENILESNLSQEEQPKFTEDAQDMPTDLSLGTGVDSVSKPELGSSESSNVVSAITETDVVKAEDLSDSAAGKVDAPSDGISQDQPKEDETVYNQPSREAAVSASQEISTPTAEDEMLASETPKPSGVSESEAENAQNLVMEEGPESAEVATTEASGFPVSLVDSAALAASTVASLSATPEALTTTVSSVSGILPGVTMPTALLPQLPVLQMEGGFSVPTLMFSPPLPVTSPPPAQVGMNRMTMLTSIFQPNLPMLQNLMHSSQGNLNQVLTQLQINSMCQGQVFQQLNAVDAENSQNTEQDAQCEGAGEKKDIEKKKGKARKRERRKSSATIANMLQTQQTDNTESAKEANPPLPSPVDPSQWCLSAEQIAALTMNMNLIQMMTLNPSVALDPNFVQTFQQTLHTLQTQAMQHPQSALHMLQAMNYMQQHLSPFLGAAGNFAMLQQQNAAFLQQFTGIQEPGEVLTPVIPPLSVVPDGAGEDSKASDETMSMSSGSKSPGAAGAGLNDSFNSGSTPSRGHSPRSEGRSKSPRKSDGSSASGSKSHHSSSHSSPRRQRSPRSEHSPRVSDVSETRNQPISDAETIPNPANLTEAVTSVVRAQKLNVFGEFLDQDSNETDNNQGQSNPGSLKTYQSRLKSADTSTVSASIASLPFSSETSAASIVTATTAVTTSSSLASSDIPTTASTTTCTSSATISSESPGSTGYSDLPGSTGLSEPTLSTSPCTSPTAKSKNAESEDIAKSEKSSPQKTSEVDDTAPNTDVPPDDSVSETVAKSVLETESTEVEPEAAPDQVQVQESFAEIHTSDIDIEPLDATDSQDSQATECCDPPAEQGSSSDEASSNTTEPVRVVSEENIEENEPSPLTNADPDSEKVLDSTESQAEVPAEKTPEDLPSTQVEVQTNHKPESENHNSQDLEDPDLCLPEDLSLKKIVKDDSKPAHTTSPTSSPPMKRTRWSSKLAASSKVVVNSNKSDVSEEIYPHLEESVAETQAEANTEPEMEILRDDEEITTPKAPVSKNTINKNAEKPMEIPVSKEKGIDRVINSVMQAANLAAKEGNIVKSPPSKVVGNASVKALTPTPKAKVTDNKVAVKATSPTAKVVSTCRPAGGHKRPGEPLNGIVSRLKRNAEKKTYDPIQVSKDGPKLLKDSVKQLIDGKDGVNEGEKVVKDGLKDQTNDLTVNEDTESVSVKKAPTDSNEKLSKDTTVTPPKDPTKIKNHLETNDKDANTNSKDGKGTSRVLNCISTNKQTSGNLKKKHEKDPLVTSEEKVITKTVDTEVAPITEGHVRGVKRLVDEEEPECSHGETTDDDANSIDDSNEERTPRHFEIGDLVWGPLRGFPSWPGKLVHETEVRGNPKSEDGKVWVRWFGEHSFTQVEPDQLKTLTEGLDAHHNARQNYRKGRKIQPALEVAIMEAMNELDKQTEVSSQNENKSASSTPNANTSPCAKSPGIIKTSPPSNRVPTSTTSQEDKNSSLNNKTPKSAKKRRTR